MKIVVSPAKSLITEGNWSKCNATQPVYLEKTVEIQKHLKKYKPKELMDLMHVSQNLADLNWQRNQNWSVPFTETNARPALFTFDGDVYTGIDANTIPSSDYDFLQERLRILSGLYGILKPFDLMQAYRLEMGTKMAIGKNKNLYDFWKKQLTEDLNKELKDNELFINLASNEYFKAIDVKTLKVPIITPEFKDYKNDKLKIISFFAKKARGLMVRYIVDNKVETIEDLKKFNYEGYAFDASLSTATNLVFTR